MASIFNEEVGGYVLNVEAPSKDEDNWTVIQQQSFTIDKGEFVLNHFKKDFPKMKIKDYDQLLKIISRSKKLSEWYSKVSLLFADSIQLPLAFKDKFDPNEYQQLFSDIKNYKENLALESADIQRESAVFDQTILKIRNKYKKLNDVIINKNKVYPILTLTKEKLPISAQIQIEDYTPKTGDVTQKKTAYAREILIQYQRALVDLVKENNDVDILAVIDQMSEK
jgi:hypothetical protein